MGVHGIIANDAAVGTTIGTFEAIDTRNADVRLRGGTTAVVGLAVCAVRAARTTGDAQLHRLRLTSADLGIAAGAMDMLLGTSDGGGTATNSGASVVPAEWIALDLPARGGNVVNMAFSQAGIEPTDLVSVEVAVAHMTAVKPPPPKWFDYSAVGGTLPKQGSVSSNGGSTANVRTTLTAATIPGRFTQIVSQRNVQSQDPIAVAGEESSAFYEYTSTIGDWEPQEWPSSGIGASLGTATGAGPYGQQDELPFWFVKEAVTETVEPFVTTITAVGAANAFAWSLGLRE